MIYHGLIFNVTKTCKCNVGSVNFLYPLMGCLLWEMATGLFLWGRSLFQGQKNKQTNNNKKPELKKLVTSAESSLISLRQFINYALQMYK